MSTFLRPVRKKRSRPELELEFLTTIQQGETIPTRVYNSLNTSWDIIKEIETKFIERGLIKVIVDQNLSASKIEGKRPEWLRVLRNVHYELTPEGERKIRLTQEALAL